MIRWDNFLDLYQGRARFESQQEHRPSRMMSFVVLMPPANAEK